MLKRFSRISAFLSNFAFGLNNSREIAGMAELRRTVTARRHSQCRAVWRGAGYLPGSLCEVKGGLGAALADEVCLIVNR